MNITEIEEKMESLPEEAQSRLIQKMEDLQARISAPLNPLKIAKEYGLTAEAYLNLSDSAREEVQASYKFNLAKSLTEDFRHSLVSESGGLITQEEATFFCNKCLGFNLI